MENERLTQMTPARIYQAGEFELGICWQDGHESVYPCSYLRKACKCASCIDEFSGQQILDVSKVSDQVHPIDIQGVGRYGIQINWSDRHRTGIYDFKYLRSLCLCPECIGINKG